MVRSLEEARVAASKARHPSAPVYRDHAQACGCDPVQVVAVLSCGTIVNVPFQVQEGHPPNCGCPDH